jgi:hypothetical protein
VDIEQASSGQLSVWRKVYNTMCCPGPACKKGFYCWVDPIGKKSLPTQYTPAKEPCHVGARGSYIGNI